MTLSRQDGSKIGFKLGKEHTLIIYERGAITDDTSCRFDRPYRAAPLNVAVSASSGLTITPILDANVSLIEM